MKSAESLHQANHLVQKIDSLCKDIENALALCFELTGEKVAGHSITLTHKMDSEFVDRVVLALHDMKHHLGKLKTSLHQFDHQAELTTIVDGLKASSANLNQLVSSNNFFHNTFGLLISEVQVMIDEVLKPAHVLMSY